jgi:hypothetical protein
MIKFLLVEIKADNKEGKEERALKLVWKAKMKSKYLKFKLKMTKCFYQNNLAENCLYAT